MFNLITSDNIKNDDFINDARRRFHNDQIVVIEGFFSEPGRAALFDEVRRLKSHLVKRHIESEPTTGTPRFMSTLGFLEIQKYTTIIPMLYKDPCMLNWLTRVAGQQVFVVPDKNENVVINNLSTVGDLHGGHTDTYSYAFNIVYEFPPEHCGGQLLITPGSAKISDLNTENAEAFSFNEGDAYFLRTDLNAHCVAPLTRLSSRTVLNYAYASAENAEMQSYSSDVLYG